MLSIAARMACRNYPHQKLGTLPGRRACAAKMILCSLCACAALLRCCLGLLVATASALRVLWVRHAQSNASEVPIYL